MSDATPLARATARSAMAKASWRILPLLGLGYLVAYMDRVNIGFAAVRMNTDLHFSATTYGVGGGLFFLSYALFEVPSNLLLVRFGARRWIARIMITWGLLAAAMMFVATPWQFYTVRFLLGLAEAGFFPGAIYYMSSWFPMCERGRAISRFYVAGPVAGVVMGVVSGALMGLDGLAGLKGWQWLFLAEGLPSVAIGFAVLRFLPERPGTAAWLEPAEKDWLTRELAADSSRMGEPARHDLPATLANPFVLLMGAMAVLSLGPFYCLTLSAPTLLAKGTGLSMTHVGYVVSLGGLLGAIGMLATGAFSDRRGDRFGVLTAATILITLAYLGLALAASPLAVVVAYLLFTAAWTTVTAAQVAVWADVLPVRILAVGGAATNSIGQAGAFLGPIAWGVSRDVTGDFRAGLFALAAASLLLLGLVVVLRRLSLRGRGAPAAAAAAPG